MTSRPPEPVHPPLAARQTGLRVAPRTVLRWTVAVAIFFLVADVLATIAVVAGAEHDALLVHLFDSDVEANPPTWYSGLLLSAASLAAFVRGLQERSAGTGWARQWYGLAALLLLMSLDEAAVLHDITVGPTVDAVTSLGVSKNVARAGAVMVVCVGLAALAAPFWRWLRALPVWARRAYVVAVLLFVGAALGMEVVARVLEMVRGYREVEQDLLSGIEEFLEMLGSITLLVTTLALFDGKRVAADPPR